MSRNQRSTPRGSIRSSGPTMRAGCGRRCRWDRPSSCWSAPKPKPRTRNLAAIAACHRSRISDEPAGRMLDDRTWDDLNLDAVFEAIDRTESTLGREALYHRLRTAPRPVHLAAFEALVARF